MTWHTIDAISEMATGKANRQLKSSQSKNCEKYSKLTSLCLAVYILVLYLPPQLFRGLQSCSAIKSLL